MTAAVVGAKIVRSDDRQFADDHGGDVREVVARERTRSEWAQSLLEKVKRD
jgi:hypothetical protein